MDDKSNRAWEKMEAERFVSNTGLAVLTIIKYAAGFGCTIFFFGIIYAVIQAFQGHFDLERALWAVGGEAVTGFIYSKVDDVIERAEADC